MPKCNQRMWRADGVSDRVGIHTICASSVWERSMHGQLSRGLPVMIVSFSRLAVFDESGQVCDPAVVLLLLRHSMGISWGSQVDLVEGSETGSALSRSSPARSTAPSQDQKPAPRFLPPRERARCSSEEVDVMSVNTDKTVDSPPQSIAYEELVEVVTRAVVKLNIEWPAEKQDARPKSKLDESFLKARSQPSRRGLPFFPDLHTEVTRSWEKPYSSRIFSPTVSNYANITGLNDARGGADA